MEQIKHVVLTGDIIASRENYKDSNWKQIQDIIDQINETFSKLIKVPMIIYAGDSVGVVTEDLSTAYEIGIEISEALLPVAIRYNIVEGEIEYGLESENFGVLQGEAFWKSNKLLKELEKTAYKTFIMETGNPRLDETVSHMTNLIHNIKAGWSEKQLEVAKNYRELGRQTEVAMVMETSQQYISKVLKTTGYYDVNDCESYIRTILKEWN